MQTHLFAVCGEDIFLSTILPTQPVLTVATQQASEERHNAIQEEIKVEIEEKQERIQELRKEIGDDEEALFNAELDELDDEPDAGEELIFDAVAPMLEEDLNHTRSENEEEIRAIEEEITAMEAKLK